MSTPIGFKAYPSPTSLHSHLNELSALVEALSSVGADILVPFLIHLHNGPWYVLSGGAKDGGFIFIRLQTSNGQSTPSFSIGGGDPITELPTCVALWEEAGLLSTSPNIAQRNQTNGQ